VNQLAIMAWCHSRTKTVDRSPLEASATHALPKVNAARTADIVHTEDDPGSMLPHAIPVDDALDESVQPSHALMLLNALETVGMLTQEAIEICMHFLQRCAMKLDAKGPDANASVHELPASGSQILPSTLDATGELGSEPCILEQQPHVCVLWKPVGWTVSVGADHHAISGSVLEEEEGNNYPNAAHTERSLQKWVMEQMGHCFPVTQDSEVQHGLLHRLDKGTSGLLACATSYKGFYQAKLAFYIHRVRKEYVCLCEGFFRKGTLMLDMPLKVVYEEGFKKRSKVARDGATALTELRAIHHLVGPGNEAASLVEVRLHSGRLHQIRAHLSNEGHPLVADALYGTSKRSWCRSIFLHACFLCLQLDSDLTSVDAICPLPGHLRTALAALTVAEGRSRSMRWGRE